MKAPTLLLFLAISISVISCGQKNSPETEPEETVFSVVGVWKDGNNHIISFNKDGFYCAYLGDKFIDNGTFLQEKNLSIKCDNYYYNRETQYHIRGIDEKNLKVLVTSKDVFGDSFSKEFSLKKTDIEPTAERHPLSQKSYTYQAQNGKVTVSFATNDTGVKSHTATNQSRCPLKFFYIFINGYAYLQYGFLSEVMTIGGWTDLANSKEIQALKISFSDDGSISFIGDDGVL